MDYLRMPNQRDPRRGLILRAAISLFLTLGTGLLSAEVPPAEGGGGAEETPKRALMNTDGLEPKLSRVLSNYYRRTFTGPENWESVESVMFVGILQTPQGKFHFSAYKKKPNLSKVVIRSPQNQGRIVFAYDGNVAWQSNSIVSDTPRPMLMPPAEAKNFIRDASIGGHLLDPLQEGKQIEITGIVEVDDFTCYQIEVTLPDGQRIRSAVDILEYAERQQTTINYVNNKEEMNTFDDFRVIDGVRFPFASTMKSGGEEVHRVKMLKIRVNPGLTEAIFQRSSEIVAPASEAPIFDASQETAPSVNRFGEVPFGGSAFPEPDELNSESVLDEIQIP